MSKGKDIITIDTELEHIKNYLLIQEMRYGDVLSYDICVDKNALTGIIPKITLQPLVENSIYHGFKAKDGKKGHICIKVERQQAGITITVKDDGIGMKEHEMAEMNRKITQYDSQFGYGVRNVNRRIQLYYGSDFGLRYYPNPEGGVIAKIELPYWEDLKGEYRVL